MSKIGKKTWLSKRIADSWLCDTCFNLLILHRFERESQASLATFAEPSKIQCTHYVKAEKLQIWSLKEWFRLPMYWHGQPWRDGLLSILASSIRVETCIFLTILYTTSWAWRVGFLAKSLRNNCTYRELSLKEICRRDICLDCPYWNQPKESYCYDKTSTIATVCRASGRGKLHPIGTAKRVKSS